MADLMYVLQICCVTDGSVVYLVSENLGLEKYSCSV
jgi:hypothetical protein